MNSRLIYNLLIPFLLFLSSACAPGFGNNLNVTTKEIAPSEILLEKDGQVVFIPLKIAEVSDVRNSVFIGSVNGRTLLAEPSVELAIKTLLENECKSKGYTLSEVAETVVSAELRDWFVDVKTGFPLSTAIARASLVISVAVPDRGQRFFAEYSGTAEIKHPFLSQARVEAELLKAMQNAISTAFTDERLLSKL